MPRVLIGLARQHYTWELVEASGAFALHLMGEEHLEWVWRFGLQSGRDQDKYAGLVFHTAASGSPLLRDALGWLDCRVEATHGQRRPQRSIWPRCWTATRPPGACSPSR